MCGDREAAGATILKPPSGRGRQPDLPLGKTFALQFQTPPLLPRRPRNKTEIAEMQPSCAKFSNPDSGQSGGGDAPIADSVPSGWSAELRGGSGVAAPIGRRQTFEIVPQVVTAPFFKFSTFRLGAVGAATLLPSRRLLPLRCRVAGRRPQGPTPRAKLCKL